MGLESPGSTSLATYMSLSRGNVRVKCSAKMSVRL